MQSFFARTTGLKDFFFFTVLLFYLFTFYSPVSPVVLANNLHERCFSCCAEDGGDDVTENLEYCFPCFVHNSVCF